LRIERIDSRRIGEGVATGAHFAFEKDDRGVIGAGVVFEIDPQVFLFSDKADDIAIVGLSKRAAVGTGELSDFGTVTVVPTLGKILVGHSINIIQHPDGRHKHWALQNNRLYVEPRTSPHDAGKCPIRVTVECPI
jgi:hypothetical protein